MKKCEAEIYHPNKKPFAVRLITKDLPLNSLLEEAGFVPGEKIVIILKSDFEKLNTEITEYEQTLLKIHRLRRIGC